MENIVGRIHSVESFGAVDGPGIRFVVFVQGCPLRCRFCHNPDSWNSKDGREVTAQALAKEIETYRNFIKNGGVTVSGGEPLAQPQFVAELLRLCKKNGFHTAIDTSGGVPLDFALPALEQADLVLLDIKDIDDDDCRTLTGQGNGNALNILRYCEENRKPVWLRHVVVPGYTMDTKKLERIAELAQANHCVEKVELLPFHKMGEYKWEVMGESYQLKDTPSPTEDEMEKVKKLFLDRGVPLV